MVIVPVEDAKYMEDEESVESAEAEIKELWQKLHTLGLVRGGTQGQERVSVFLQIGCC